MSDPLHAMALAAADVKSAASPYFDKMVDEMFKYEVKCIDELLGCEERALVEARSRARTIRQVRLKLQACMLIRDQAEKRK
jgi:hypothetical protein